MDQHKLPVEAIGDDEHQRPQPADEPISTVESQDLYRVMRHTIERLEKDQAATAVWISQRHLRFTGAVHALLDGAERVGFFAIVSKLLDNP